MGTPFEVIPYMGLWRIATVSPRTLALLGAILVPMIVLPSLWGIIASIRQLLKRDFASPVLMLGVSAAFVPFTPYSTFREPYAIVRVATGLVLACILFGGHVRSRRILNYSLFWFAGLALLR